MTVDSLPSITDACLDHKIRLSFDVLEKCLNKYSPNQIAVSFNGGKDCTVVLHQYSLALKKYFSQSHQSAVPMQALFINNKPQFDTVIKFIDDSVKKYDINLIRIDAPIKEALFQLKISHPHIQCIIMGTRSTDPYSSSLHEFSPTDPTWPEYMRCNPILNYSYKDVWTYLRQSNVPYCSMYDEGFTSLGDKERTIKNINLRYVNHDTGSIEYKPAYMLDDEISERNGRE